MRKYLFIPFILLPAATFSQNWPSPGANWIYQTWSGLMGIDGLIEYSYTQDTIIQGKSCKEIKGTFAGENASKYWPPGTYTVDPNYERYYTYEDKRVVYLYVGNGIFDTVADFNAVVGDSWRTLSECGNRWSLTVTDTTSKIINGTRLKEVTAETKIKFDWNPDTSVIEYVFLEKLFNSSSIFPTTCYDPSTLADYPFQWLNCYQDNSFGTHNPNGAPCYKGVGINRQFRSGYSIGPNPFSDYLEIGVGPSVRIKLLDLNGRVLQDLDCGVEEKIKLLTSHLPAGLYFLELGREAQSCERIKIIKQ